MALTDFLYFQNPETVAIALGALTFIIVFYALTRITGNRGTSLIAALVIGVMAGWALLRNDFYGEQSILVLLLLLLIAAIILKIVWSFLKGARRGFRR